MKYGMKRLLVAVACLLGMLVACESDPGDGDTGGVADGANDTGGDTGAEPDYVAEGPTIESFYLTESPESVLAILVEVETDRNTILTVKVEHVDSGVVTVFEPRDVFNHSTSHEFYVLGLVAETTYEISIVVEDVSGNTEGSEPESYTTAPLPSDFPPVRVNAIDTERVSPGYTLVNVNRWNPGNDQNFGYLIAFDEAGQVVWYHNAGIPLGDVELRENGNILYVAGVNAGFEIDFSGEQAGFWFAPNIGMESVHHYLGETPGGNLIAIGTERRVIDGYATADGGTTSYNVIGDVINEFTQEGEQVDSWSIFDYLDPLDVPEDLDDPYWDSFNDNFWDFLYEGGSSKDWSHANAVLFDPSDGHMLVSLRHLDTILKIDRDNDELVWRLGPDGDFTMTGDGEWPYHQHGPELQANGNILVYDNGNHRPGLAEGEHYFTRAVEYAFDEDEMTAEEVWEFRGEEPYFAPYVGAVQRLENGNVLITDGGILSDSTARETDPDGGRWGRIVEVTHTDPGEVVWSVEIRDNSDALVGYNLSRAIRFSSFYP